MKILIIGLLVILTIGSCSQKTTFLPSSRLPTVQGYVKIRKDHNSHYGVILSVTNLANTQLLDPAKKNYVLWAETADIRSESLGRFQTSKSMLSKSSKGKLASIITTEPVRFFITAEEHDYPQFPSDQIILMTKHFNLK